MRRKDREIQDKEEIYDILRRRGTKVSLVLENVHSFLIARKHSMP